MLRLVQLFFVDDSTGGASLDVPESGEEHAGGSEEEELIEGDRGEEDMDEEMVVDSEKIASTSTAVNGRKVPAWIDPDDNSLNVSLASNRRLRKLRDTVEEDTVGGKEYERKLRRQFEKINPTPEWAKKARTQLHPAKSKRRRPSVSSDEEESRIDDELPDLLASTGGILGPRPRTLQQGLLSIERLRDANLSARSEGAVKAVQFHPSTQIPVMLTAGEDRRLRLFNVRAPTTEILAPY